MSTTSGGPNVVTDGLVLNLELAGMFSSDLFMALGLH